MKKKNVFLAFLLLTLIVFPGADLKKTPPPIQLEDGDSFVFIGNSITHQCLYTQYIEDYYYTRHPEKRIYFHNAGVSGDVAKDVFARFDEDVAAFNPKYASILIGMNDAEYTEFDYDIFKRYKKDMSLVLKKLEQNHISPILLTPTMFDLRAVLLQEESEFEDPGNIHYNATLGFFGAWLGQVAEEKGYGYVNMYEALNRLTREARQEQADFTFIEDAVHPGPGGQFVMALAFLKDVGAGALVSSIHIDVRKKGWKLVAAENGILERREDRNIKFQFKAGSLPWVVPEEALQGYELSGASSSMNREVLRISGLSPGDYTLKIDDITLGSYSHLQFSEGIELQDNKQTPQYLQAAEIARINSEKNREAVEAIRDLWLVRKFMTIYSESPEEFENDEEGIEIRDWMESEFGTSDMDSFMESFQERLKPLEEKARAYEEQIYYLNKPGSHVYEILKSK